MYRQDPKHMNMRMDYLKLCEKLRGPRQLVRATFYTLLSNQSEGKIDFVNFLKLNGFNVVTKEVKMSGEGDGQVQRSPRGNLDVDMTVDAMEMAQRLDTVIICSGDGDFVPLVRSLGRQGCRVEVCALRDMTSTDLIAHCDVYTDLDTLRGGIALDAPPQTSPRSEGGIPRNELIDYNQIEY